MIHLHTCQSWAKYRPMWSGWRSIQLPLVTFILDFYMGDSSPLAACVYYMWVHNASIVSVQGAYPHKGGIAGLVISYHFKPISPIDAAVAVSWWHVLLLCRTCCFIMWLFMQSMVLLQSCLFFSACFVTRIKELSAVILHGVSRVWDLFVFLL